MKAFELPAGTRLKITKTTPRKEVHGEEHVQAISLRLAWTTGNEALAKLHDGLLDMLYFDPPEVAQQLQIDGLPPVKKHLRCAIVDTPLKIQGDGEGYTLTIDHGIDASSALELYACAVKKFDVDPVSGGAVTISFSVASNSKITPELVGALCALEGDEVTAELKAPKAGEQAIDGSIEAFKADHPGADERDAGDLFADAHGNDQHAGDFGTPDRGDDEGGPRTSDDAGVGDAGGEAGGDAGQGGDDAAAFEAGVKQALNEAAAFEAGVKQALNEAGVAPKGRRSRKAAASIE